MPLERARQQKKPAGLCEEHGASSVKLLLFFRHYSCAFKKAIRKHTGDWENRELVHVFFFASQCDGLADQASLNTSHESLHRCIDECWNATDLVVGRVTEFGAGSLILLLKQSDTMSARLQWPCAETKDQKEAGGLSRTMASQNLWLWDSEEEEEPVSDLWLEDRGHFHF